MPPTLTYSQYRPLTTQISTDFACFYPRRHTRHDGSGCPHTYGVRYCLCTPFATNPCRPTACTQHATPAPPSPIINYYFLIINWIYSFSAKEHDVETGLSYFGSRYYSSDLSIWLSVDPMSDKYASLSPYVYCADNPVKLVDPNGEKIDPASQEEWNSNKQQLTATLINRVFQSVTNSMENNSSYTNKSIMSLFKTLSIMNQMEQDPNWEFALFCEKNKKTGYTMLTRDPEHNMAYLFKVGYVDMANFVHEITHCGQFLNGEVGFEETDKGFTPLVDIYDELDAYKSQYYYNQNSLPLNKYPILTKDWLYNIKDDIGVYPYRYIGRLSYDGYATEAILKAAYPKSAQVFDNMRGYLFHQPRVIFQIKRKDVF